jgi:hypothetical protein
MAAASSNGCPQCADFLRAALEASHAYHGLLGFLEAAHIRADHQEAYRLQVQVNQAVQRRDHTLAELGQHRRTHADDLVDGKTAAAQAFSAR